MSATLVRQSVAMADAERPSMFLRAQAGEPVVDALVAENLPRLHAYVRAHMPGDLRQRETDVDLLQSICVELIAERARFDFRGEAQFRAWMFTAARNKLLEKVRFHGRAQRDVRREVAPDSSMTSGLGDSVTPSRVAAGAERRRLVEQALAALPDDYREVVTLTHYAGLSPTELADHFGRSPAAVRMLLGRALAKLGDELRRLGLEVSDLAP